MNFSNQIHDFDPGIAPSGLFWTVALPDGSVRVHDGAGEAFLDATGFALRDFVSIPNALSRGPSMAATVTFHVHWSGMIRRVKTRDVANGFAGEFVENMATLEWSGQTDSFHFLSDPASTSISVFAEVGHERNGAFFRQGEG